MTFAVDATERREVRSYKRLGSRFTAPSRNSHFLGWWNASAENYQLVLRRRKSLKSCRFSFKCSLR